MAPEKAMRSAIEGQYVLIPTKQVSLAFGLQKAGAITGFDLRVWFAIHETIARRQGSEVRRYTRSELARLLGGGGGRIASSLKRLEAAQFVAWSREGIRIRSDVEKSRAGRRVQSHQHEKRLCVPVPRRILRWLAADSNHATRATVMGYLLRCPYKHGETFDPDGAVKASWIAEAFGVSERSVKRARRRLVDVGWLERLPDPGAWYRKRYGSRWRVNLLWTPQARAYDDLTNLSPQKPVKTAQSVTSRSDQNSLYERDKNQSPGAAPPEPPWGSSIEKVTRRAIGREDLASPERLDKLYVQFLDAGHLTTTDNDRLNFFAAAERALEDGREPGALFTWLVVEERWDYLTQAHEDRARAKMKRLDGEEPDWYEQAGRAAMEMAIPGYADEFEEDWG